MEPEARGFLGILSTSVATDEVDVDTVETTLRFFLVVRRDPNWEGEVNMVGERGVEKRVGKQPKQEVSKIVTKIYWSGT